MRFCGKCGQPLHQSSVSLDRERRSVSTVFIDLSGFTKLTYDFDPEALRDLADGVLTVVAGIIEDYDGYVDAFQGDGLIALFGAPHSHPDDPYRAVKAAAVSLEAIEAIGEDKGYPLKGRAGVNTGVVIAGSVGSGRVKDYTVMGSAVNLAARLEAAATPGEVWVGPATFEATRHRASYQLVSGVSLPGFPDITEVHKLSALDSALPHDPYAELRFIGRSRELVALEAKFDESVTSGRVKTAWLYGEVGSGKTRLVGKLADRLRAHAPHVFILEEQSLNAEAMWRELGGHLFEAEPGGPQWEELVRRGVTQLLPGEPRWQTYILRSLGLAASKPWRRLERRSVDRTFVAWRDLLLAFARRAPGTLLVVEHSSQGSSFGQFLDLLQAEAAPLFILRTSRERHATPNADGLRLGPLNLQESLALISQVTDASLRVATESLILQVGGIPANVLELGRALGTAPQLSFSDSLASLLQARLDSLAPEARQVLILAALTGERSWDGLAVNLIGPESRERLTELVRERLLVREGGSSVPDEAEYRFQSELLRRVVLDMVPYSERPLLHLRIATWLEAYAPLDLSANVGYHFREGNSHEAAYPHYLAAADLAVSEQDARQAYGLFDELLTLELPGYLLAQGALAYAQAALSYQDWQLAAKQLSRAKLWTELCSPEDRDELLQVHAQLNRDLKSTLDEDAPVAS